MTAVFAVLRAGERPPRLFWLASAGGLLAVLVFLAASGARPRWTVAWPTCSCSPPSCSAAWGTPRAARSPGNWAAPGRSAGRCCSPLPVTAPVTVVAAIAAPPHADGPGWAAFGYLTVVSMFLGFFAWYAGLARGGIARVGQIQLAQPVLTLAWSALLLAETVTAGAIAAALVVLVFVVLTQRTRAQGPEPVDPGPSSCPGQGLVQVTLLGAVAPLPVAVKPKLVEAFGPTVPL